ncbi:CubicO group peptidase (beta-lactamase class C family) [Aquabacterium commune]|uniref:CubicO group peptidase (Beta-lactamase class C family) n=1 Tax=Aquabacterium commune TaxID=70586 RepID=A0A4R6RFM2_9BURK|nr:serine hydrolase domain-containing protein [Aquabacterium commune]TDP84587.1 CubicO group peptidase (beta-lactamase class C family) [Aquabacterium commune]
MSKHPIDSTLSRRSVLQLFLSAGLGLSLAACGGGSDEPEQDQAAAPLRTQADAAVDSGLVGVALGQVTDKSFTVAVAGKRRLGEGAPVAPQDRFAIGSNTKAMTCAAIVALADLGGPALSLTLPQAFTEWAGDIHPDLAQVTLADLLHHRGGLPAFNGSGPEEDAFIAAVQADPRPLPETMEGRRAYFARWLLAQPPVEGIVPGRDFHYSNAGYVLAAAIVEAHTGKAFETLFDEVLAQPLALQGAWRSPVPSPTDLLWGHEGAAGALAVVEATEEDIATKDWLDIMAPDGHWACTGAAYAQWLRWHVLALRGQLTPLPQTYVNDLRTVSDGHYTWGWEATATPGRKLLTHTGHVPGFMAEVVVDRAGEFAAFGLSNTGYVAEDGTSWVLKRIDQAMAEVLKRQSIAL